LVIRIRDITEHFETREQLRTQARTDPLTGLLAWQELERRLEALLGHEPRTGTRTAFAMMEVGGVGHAREQHSEAVADELLRVVADRIRGALRESDLVARGAGDQLAAMLVGVERMTDAVEVLQRVVQEVGAPHVVDGSVLRPRLSIGVTEALPDEWPEWVISRAEQALDNSRNRGANRVSLAGGRAEPSASAQVIAFPGRKG
jgi:diguanylate cyclase (GGDEF)-like protein